MAQIRFRFFKIPLALSLKLALLASFFVFMQIPQVLLAKGIPQRWETNEYEPPDDIDAPTRVEGGGTRDSGDDCLATGKSLTALIPSSRFAVTVASYPAFFVYMPASLPGKSPLLVEFVLEDKEGNEVYTANFRTSGTAGIVTLSLPTQGGLSPLVVGKDYKWFFSVVCQEDDRSKDAVVEGWVRRVELKPTLKTQLAQASLQKQVELYAEAEIWQDALATLVQLRRDKPNDSAIAADWAKLLSAAGLDNIAQESLLPIPTAPRVSVR